MIGIVIDNVTKPTHKIEEKIDQRHKNYPLLGGGTPLNYINEQLLDDTNEKTSFLYIGVHGVKI